ncbi:phage tail assembly protein T [Lysobacter fragariae]
MELSLALGRPPSQLQATLLYADVAMYRAYTAKHGPLSPVRMYDRPAALIAHVVGLNRFKKPPGIADFLPFHSQPEPSEEDIVRGFLKDTE